MIRLSSTERISNRPFTHPNHTSLEKRILRYMLLCVCQTLESLTRDETQSVMHEDYEADGRHHRIILIRPALLASRQHFSVVGFFGQRSFDADDGDIISRDNMLHDEMGAHEGLLSYSSLELTNGDYGNCVLFTDDAAKNAWGKSVVHDIAVRELSPAFYHSVRLYNGILDAPLIENHKLRLNMVKYFDYSEQPIWMAQRVF